MVTSSGNENAKRKEPTTADIMTVALSHHLNDGELVIMGAYSMIPMLASRLAQMTHAPNLNYIAGGSGAVNPRLDPLVSSSCDVRNLKAECVLPLSTVIDFEGKTNIDLFFAGGLQVDRFGNCNLVGIGKYPELKLRGPGTVGLPFLARARRFAIYTQSHDPRTFIEKVDIISGPGFFDGENYDNMNIPSSGPALAVTPMAVLDFHEKSHSMRLKSTHPGITAEQVQEQTGFELIIPDSVPESKIPTGEELEIMKQLDPIGTARFSLK
jgi:glutaconate CoA-transferase subunit B